jgi:hypothetical protein
MHHQQRRDDREVRDRVQHHEPADAEGDDQDAADQRTDERRAVERRGVQADRAHELAIGDQARDHRLTGRGVEREDDRVERADEDDLDDVDPAGNG